MLNRRALGLKLSKDSGILHCDQEVSIVSHLDDRKEQIKTSNDEGTLPQVSTTTTEAGDFTQIAGRGVHPW